MNIYKYTHWLGAGVLFLSLAACNLGNAATQTPENNTNIDTPTTTEISATKVSATEAPTAAPPESAGACDNPYFPVVAGATWNYKLTGTVSDTYTHTILLVESDSFTEQDEF